MRRCTPSNLDKLQNSATKKLFDSTRCCIHYIYTSLTSSNRPKKNRKLSTFRAKPASWHSFVAPSKLTELILMLPAMLMSFAVCRPSSFTFHSIDYLLILFTIFLLLLSCLPYVVRIPLSLSVSPKSHFRAKAEAFFFSRFNRHVPNSD